MNVFNPTPEEAIHELENVKNDIAYIEIDAPRTKVKRWPAITFSAFKMATEALEKQIPRKPISKGHGYDLCPTCGKALVIINPDKVFCPYCGQALDWTEVEI